VNNGFGCRRADFCRGCRLDDSNWFGLRLRSGDWFGDDNWLDGRRYGLRLRLDLCGWRCRLLGRCLLCRRGGIGSRLGCFGRRGGLGRCRLLRSRLLHRLDFLGLLLTSQTITNCATFEPIGLCFDEGARVGLHTHTHCIAQRHHFGVGHSELLGELVHAHVFRQNQFSLSLASACRTLFRRPLILSCW
jgi:hypothetical protein